MTKKKKTISSSLFNLLPEEIIINEILLKLPTESILQLRHVSMYFRRLISRRSFTNKHQEHHSNTTKTHLLITYRHDSAQHHGEIYRHYSCNFSNGGIVDNPSIKVPELIVMYCPFYSAGIYGSCNGLLFLHGTQMESKKHGFIWNPCTQEYRKITTPSIDENLFGGIVISSRLASCSGFCGFGYDRLNDKHKILYYDNRVGHLPAKSCNLESIVEFKLYTLESNTWKYITNNPCRNLFFSVPWKKRTGILVNRALHWIMSCIPSSSLVSASYAQIISFDIEQEEFLELHKPPAGTTFADEHEYYYKELLELQECLCLYQCPGPTENRIITRNAEIWMLKDYGMEDSWTKLFTIRCSEYLLPLRYLKLFRFDGDGDFRMHRDFGRGCRVVVCDGVNYYESRFSENIYNLTKCNLSHGVIYKPSLVSFNSAA